MTDTVQLLEIGRELELLDEQFESDKKMSLDEFTRRRQALLKRQRDAEHDAKMAAARRAAEPRPAAPKAQRYVMPVDDVRALMEMEHSLKIAREAGDQAAFEETIQREEFIHLLLLEERQHAGEVGSAYAAAVGARLTFAMKYITLLGMRGEALEKRIRELESAIPKYCGTYKAGETYAKNALVTDHGSLWIALEPTTTRPPGAAWQLCVQRGRDGGKS